MKDTVDSVQLSAPEVVTASSGGSVTVSCQYDLTFRENTKYWCKGAVYDFCVIVVTTSKNPIRDRSSIADDKEEGVFSVTVESFGKSDEGMYWCVISTPGRNIHKAVRLLVSHTGMPQLTQLKSNTTADIAASSYYCFNTRETKLIYLT